MNYHFIKQYLGITLKDSTISTSTLTNTISTISIDNGNFFELQGKLFCNLGFNNRFSGLIFQQSFGQLFEGLAETAVSYVFSDAQDMDFQLMKYFLLL